MSTPADTPTRLADTRLFKRMERARQLGQYEAHVPVHEWIEFVMLLSKLAVKRGQP